MRIVRYFLMFVSFLFVGILILREFYIVNVTPSLPYGVYEIDHKPYEKGDLVAVCPPISDLTRTAYNRGYILGGDCPGGYGYLLKKILAAKMDTVEIKVDGVYVNDVFIPNSKPLAFDGDGLPMPILIGQKYILGVGEFFCLSDYNPFSFDGRYYGPMKQENLRHVIVPFYTWDSKQ